MPRQREEAGDKRSEARRNNVGVDKARTEWSGEGPAGVDATTDDGIEKKKSTNNVEIPAEQVEARKGKVSCAEHQKQEKVAEDCRYGWDKYEEDHHNAVHGEDLVIGVHRHHVRVGGEKFQSEGHCEQAAHDEEKCHAY